MDTITVELPEKYYWRIVQGMSAAGTASHRHGMERHAEQFHEAEKYLFQAYERHEEQESNEYVVTIMDGDDEVNRIGATTKTLSNTIDEILETYHDRSVIVERKV